MNMIYDLSIKNNLKKLTIFVLQTTWMVVRLSVKFSNTFSLSMIRVRIPFLSFSTYKLLIKKRFSHFKGFASKTPE